MMDVKPFPGGIIDPPMGGHVGPAFGCPSCCGKLEYNGAGWPVKCAYRSTVAMVPEAIWQQIEQAQTSSQVKKWVIIIPVLTTGPPMGLDRVGTAPGTCGGILGIIASSLAAVPGLYG